MGTMASLGARTGIADILGVRITGFFAWAAWRTFYLSLLPSMATRIRVAMDWSLDLIVSRSIAEIRATQAASRYIRFLAGDLVIEPGVDPGGLYVVISGAFDSEMPEADQSRTLGPNTCFGMAIGGEAGSDQERITAREDSTVYFVEKSDLKRLAMVSALIKQGDRTKKSARSDAKGKPDRDSPS
jgi:NADH dehydrogenase